MGARSRNHCCRGKAISITYSERVALVIQHAKRMRRILLRALAKLPKATISFVMSVRQSARND
jgi:CBS domain containing-hemolysin-like protein